MNDFVGNLSNYSFTNITSVAGQSYYQIDAFKALLESSINQLLYLSIIMVVSSFWILAVQPRVQNKNWYSYKISFVARNTTYYFFPFSVLDGLFKVIIFTGSFYFLDLVIRIKWL